MMEETAQGVLLTVRLNGGQPWGFTAKEIFKDDGKSEVLLIITKIDPKGRSVGHLRLNDILLAIDGQPCRTINGARKQIQDTVSDTLALTVWRKGYPARAQPVKQSPTPINSRSPPVHRPTNTQETLVTRKDSPEVPIKADGQALDSDVIVSDHDVTPCQTEEEESSSDSPGQETDEEEEESQRETHSTMASIAPESYAKSSYRQSSAKGGQRGSLTSLPRQASRHDDDDSSSSSHSDLLMASRRPRASVDSSYPMCGLPSGTLYRKSTSSSCLRSPSSTPLNMPYMQPLSGALLPGAPSVFRPIRSSLHHSAVPEEFVEVYRSSSTMRSEFSGTPPPSFPIGSGNKLSPTNPIASLSASALGAKSQKMMDLLNGQAGSAKNIYHATPASQWSQTESSTTIYRDLPGDSGSSERRQPRSVPKSQPTDVNSSSTYCAGPSANQRVETAASGHPTDSSRPGTDRFTDNCCDYKQKERGDPRVPLAPLATNKQPDRRKSVPSGPSKPVSVQPKSANTAAVGPAGQHKGEHSSLAESPPTGIKSTELGSEFREARRMPALRPNHFIALPEDAGSARSPHLTTVKEVRTYQIRPNLSASNESATSSSSSSTMESTVAGGGTRSPVSVRSSSNSTSDEGSAGGRHHTSSHTRDASLDSHVSWQSNSTNSSGYSSVALSSSTPMLDVAVSEETLVPADYMNLQDKDDLHHGVFPVSRCASKTSINSPGPEPEIPRSVSVSEMIRTFGSAARTPPAPPPKPRYAHLPAHRPDVVHSEPRYQVERSRANSIPHSPAFASSMEDVRHHGAESPATRRASTTSQMLSSTLAEQEQQESRRDVPAKPASPVNSSLSRAPVQPAVRTPSGTGKPVPMFRTAVHGLVLGGNAPKVEKPKEAPVVEEPVVVTQSASSLEDRGYGSGEIHYLAAEEDSSSLDSVPFAPGTTGMGDVRDLKVSSMVDDPLRDVESAADQSDLQQAKDSLTARLSERTALLKVEQDNIQQDIMANDELGEDIADELAKVASAADLTRFKQHLKELEEMTALTMSLTSRLSKINISMASLRSPADDLEISTLESKKRKLESQYQDALYLQKGVDRRRQSMRSFLSQCLSVKIFQDYDEFFTTKMSLLRDVRNLDDKIRLGEEQLRCLRNSGSC